MGEAKTISVKPEVEAILATQAGTYRSVAYALLEGPAQEFYLAVADELAGVLDGYRHPTPDEEPEPEPEDQPVPARARILEFEGGAPVGTVVEVVSVGSKNGELSYRYADGGGSTWYASADAYELVCEEPDPTINVGDTARIAEAYPYPSGKNQIGTEFVVTGVVESAWTHGGQEFSFFVQGDPEDRGLWDGFIEKVYA